jgi:hypothetical protein
MPELLAQYPWLLYLLTALACLVLPAVIILYAIGFAQGREVSTPLLTIGSKPAVPPATALTEQQVDDIAVRVGHNLEKYRKEKSKARRKKTPSIPGVPAQTAKIFALELAIGRCVREAVLAYGGGWAGSSIAGFDTYFELAEQHNVLPAPLLQDISDFKWLIRPGIYGDHIGTTQLRDIEDLAAKILKDFKSLPPRRP